MTDRELLEAAAKAAGLELLWPHDPSTYAPVDGVSPRRTDTWDNWNPLTDDGDALRLAVALRMNVFHAAVRVYAMDEEGDIEAAEGHEKDANAATRRAIVRAAAAIGGAQ
jgi:hypothetical protein